jgi:hypothetical protein
MRKEAHDRRAYWVTELARLSGSFGDDSTRMMNELRAEVVGDEANALIDHLRTCGAIPEGYGHDSSEEKLYSKYTDAVIALALSALGLKSVVLEERGDSADVQARGLGYSLVADAKAFRLSRTAKNQKDFKVQAMDGWRGTLDYAVVVCPIYQLPARTSQIYQQAIARNVCVLSYSHVAALVRLAAASDAAKAEHALHTVLKSVATLHPSKSAPDYWQGVNRALLEGLDTHSALWTQEKVASLEALTAAKEEALSVLRAERDRLLGLDHQQALDELMRRTGLVARIAQVEQVEHGGLLGIGV